MLIRYTKDEYNVAKSSDKLNIECIVCGKVFKKEKRVINRVLDGRKDNNGLFCSKKCISTTTCKKVWVKCGNCNLDIFVSERTINKSKSNLCFCSRSCSVTYNNKHKNYGSRRSKLELWVENKLKELYNFEIIFNGKKDIGMELDIYIPSLKLAFELNGIIHYKPIYGIYKLNKIKNNDEIRAKICAENNIELFNINTSDSKKFNANKDIIYLDTITNIINKKINTSLRMM